MKKIYYLFLIVHLVSIKSYSQESQASQTKQIIDYQIVKLDFLKPIKLKESLSTLEHGKKYRLEIINLNRNLYKVTSTITPKDNNAEVPEIFKSIKLPAYLNFALPDKQDYSVEEVVSSLPSEESQTEFKKKVEEIKDSYAEFQKVVIFNNSIKNLFESCDETYENIDKNLISLAIGFTGNNSEFRFTQKDAVEQKVNALIDDVLTKSNELELLLNKAKALINEEISNIKIRLYEWEAKPLPKSDPDYKAGYIAYKTQGDEVTKKKSTSESLQKLLAKVQGFAMELKTFRDENKIQDLLNNYSLINESNFTFWSKPFEVKTDEIKFDIKIVSDKLLKCNRPNEVVILETVKTKGGLKVDFSSGVFFNGGNDDFLGREIQYRQVPNENSIIEARDGGDRMLLSIGALMHIYQRNAKKFNWAVSPGISTNSGFDGLNFHLGLSAIFGYKNRLVLTGGLTLREAVILDNNYEYDTEYLTTELPESPPTIKVFPKAGWFFSLTYNFSKFKTE